ncbi:hypothetical protein PROFUN_01110 [Planoprotostelium fungivorum]|uniref:Chitinase n=1 Tax=Planoprotostelium fungivorum TaxID=1890364 RepID=A0A2P6NCE4_9EUKA|nr:hypothetical protein PROFUN_01110 [Planoprotostelium fungivorum]
MASNTYSVEYAKSARSACKNNKCKKKIEKDAVRIAKKYPSDRFAEGGTQTDWFHYNCIFDALKRARKDTKKIESEDDLEGFDGLADSDQALIRQCIEVGEETEASQDKPKEKKKPKTIKKKTNNSTQSASDVSDISDASDVSDAGPQEFKLRATDDSEEPIVLKSGVNSLGRNNVRGDDVKKISRKQLEIIVRGKTIEVVRRGTNPSFLLKSREEQSTVLEKDEAVPIYNGDVISLFIDKHAFRLDARGVKPTEQAKEKKVEKVEKEEKEKPKTIAGKKKEKEVKQPPKKPAAKKTKTDSTEPKKKKKKKGGSSEESSGTDEYDANDPFINDDEAEESEDDDESATIREGKAFVKNLDSKKRKTSDDFDEENDPLERTKCKYGETCYRKNEDHLNEYWHPKKREGNEMKRQKSLESTQKTDESPAKKKKGGKEEGGKTDEEKLNQLVKMFSDVSKDKLKKVLREANGNLEEAILTLYISTVVEDRPYDSKSTRAIPAGYTVESSCARFLYISHRKGIEYRTFVSVYLRSCLSLFLFRSIILPSYRKQRACTQLYHSALMKTLAIFFLLAITGALGQCDDLAVASSNVTYSNVTSGVCDADNDYWCPQGQCCSVDGFCGSTDQYCSPINNCVNQCWSCASFGCPTGLCCSQYGYCGNSSDYCAINTNPPNCVSNCAYASPPSISYGVPGYTISSLTVGQVSSVNITGDGSLNLTQCPVQLKFFNNSESRMLQSFWFSSDPTSNSLYNLYQLTFSLNVSETYYLRLNCTCGWSWCSYSTKIGPFYVGPSTSKRAEDPLLPSVDKRTVDGFRPTWKNVIYVYQLVSQNNFARSILIPGASGTPSHNYNVIILAFWLSARNSPDQYSALGYWDRLSGSIQVQYQRSYHNVGMRVIASAFGADDNPTTRSASSVASQLASFVKSNNLDGIDIDYEAPAHPGSNQRCGNCFSASWVISLQRNLRNLLPQGTYLITHAPQGPHFSTQTNGDYPDNAYYSIHQQVGGSIDWYNIQYYNNDNIPTYNDLFVQRSGYGPNTAVFQLMSTANGGLGIGCSQIVVGKPLGSPSNHDGRGYMTPSALASAFRKARGAGRGYTCGGAMGWELVRDSSSVRWSQTLNNGFYG